MTYTLIIFVYIANVFVNRWLNFKLYKLDKEYSPVPLWGWWFSSLIFTICATVAIVIHYISKQNWFTGKHW